MLIEHRGEATFAPPYRVIHSASVQIDLCILHNSACSYYRLRILAVTVRGRTRFFKFFLTGTRKSGA